MKMQVACHDTMMGFAMFNHNKTIFPSSTVCNSFNKNHCTAWTVSTFLHPMRCSVMHPSIHPLAYDSLGTDLWVLGVVSTACLDANVHVKVWMKPILLPVTLVLTRMLWPIVHSSNVHDSWDRLVNVFTKVPCWGGFQHVDCIPRWSRYWTSRFCRLQMVLKSQAKNHSFLLGFLFARICWISNHLESPLVAFVRIPCSYSPPRICYIAW